MDTLILIGLIWVLPMWLSHEIGKSKHRAGFGWGFFLGWLGVLIVALLPPVASE